jgi:hypothetical protein
MDSYADEQGAPQDNYDGKPKHQSGQLRHNPKLTQTRAGQRDYPPRERSRSPRPEYRDSADDRVRDDDMNGRERDDRLANKGLPLARA